MAEEKIARPAKVHFITDNRRLTYTQHQAGLENPKDKGKRIEFHNGHFSTADAEDIAFLREHDDYGTLFYELPAKAAEKGRA